MKIELTDKKKQRTVNLLVIHSSATREHISYSPQQLERDHINRGFLRAGYHYIRRSGKIIDMRPLEMVGVHTKRYIIYTTATTAHKFSRSADMWPSRSFGGS